MPAGLSSDAASGLTTRLNSVDIAALSYGSASMAFFILALLLLSNWRARHHARALSVACVLSGLWASGSVMLLMLSRPMSMPLDLLEIARTGAWIIFLLFLLEPPSGRLRACLIAVGLIFLIEVIASAVAGMDGPLAVQAGLAIIVTRLMLAVFGMLLVEQLYRHTPLRERWGIKFACIGIGALFAYDFYLYSDALLFRHINNEIWAARGIVDALTAPLLALSAARNPAWALGLSISRHILFRSAALIGSSIYLLAMASSAYYMRYFGGAWGPLMQMAYLCGAVILLVSVLFSGTLRAHLKVFINKHFYKGVFDYRQEWLRFTRSLSEAGPGLGERTIQAVAELVESPAGALWLRRENGCFEAVANWNMPLPTAIEAGDTALCQFLEAKQWVIDVPECLREPERYAFLALPSWLRSVPELWLLVPLMLHGRLFGFVALSKARAKISLNWEVTDLLKIAGSQAASYLAHRESANSLMVARQFESFNRMSTFIVHDLKNLVFQLSLLLNNAKIHRANPEFQKDMMGTLDHSVKKMTLLLQKLKRNDSADIKAPLQLEPLLIQAVHAKALARPAPALLITDPRLIVLADWGRLERVIGHIIQNAIEASAQDGRVTLRLLRHESSAVVEVNDTGQGMSEDFIRERLFKPFESTKAAGMGIGMFESREYIHEIGGQLEVFSEPDVGTTFRVILPLHIEHAASPPAPLPQAGQGSMEVNNI